MHMVAVCSSCRVILRVVSSHKAAVAAGKSTRLDQPTRMAALYRVLLAAALLFRLSEGEWVEIPHLKPSSAPSAVTSSISTTIKPIASINGHVLTHSQRLLSHLHDDRATDGRWSLGAAVRWQRPVSDLLDYERPSKRVSQSSSPFITLVNVTNKVEELEESEEADDDHYPVVQTELLPFGNRYEEESIETASAASDTSKSVVQSVQHFDDFDDYDERTPVEQRPSDSEEEQQHQYAEEDGEQEDANDTAEKSTEHFHRQPPIQLQPSPTGFGGFFDFLRRMQASFVQRTAHTIGDKIRTLTGMRDQLLSTIERRIASLWMGGGRRRVKRGWMEQHGETDAMDFPSAEGALLTISFLTFAVFLIKLVLQVINTIKAKHYTYSTFAAATPVSGGLLVKRTRRYIDPHDLQAILGTIDGYRPV
ncbi:uncharacterized protein LOC128306949 [Anopheles moucheti]|uniref:uncharacterized protein LOC128306949 n=1 Tax=Anopheles moucheti TaxID=186751 RepID=UPI0022F1184A|nr:uncharacterized protein LOC128306949 [Anopheles moucheti]